MERAPVELTANDRAGAVMSKRSRLLAFGLAGLLVLAGIVGAIGFRSIFGQILSLVLVGLGLVLATGFVFLEVGLSEDRERERLSGEGTAGGERPSGRDPSARPSTRQPAPEVHSGERRIRPSLDRMRGTRRRLR